MTGRTIVRSSLIGALIAAACATPAVADVPAVVPCSLTGTAATVCKSGPGVFYGIYSNSTAAQTGTVTCYDNASAASGTAVFTSAALGATQVITLPAPRIFTNGLTCISSAAPNGTIDIYRI